MFSPTRWRFTHRAPSGLVLAESPWVDNLLTREGAYLILDVFFRGRVQSTPVRFQIGLVNSTPTFTTSAATMAGEVSGGGYARLNLDRNEVDWPTLAPDSGGGPYRIASITKTFTAVTTSIGPFTSGVLLALIPDPLDSTRTVAYLVSAASTGLVTSIAPGSSYDITIQLNLSQ